MIFFFKIEDGFHQVLLRVFNSVFNKDFIEDSGGHAGCQQTTPPHSDGYCVMRNYI